MKTLSIALAIIGLAGCHSMPKMPTMSKALNQPQYQYPTMNVVPNQQATQQTLMAYQWQLTNATFSNGERIEALFALPEKPVTLTFTESGIGIQNVCNAKGGKYVLTDKLLTVYEVMSTMMLCRGVEGSIEKAFDQRIQGNLLFSLAQNGNSPILTLTTPLQDKLVFQGVLTLDTRYGSQASIVYLEIAPQTKLCNAGVLQQQCLQVREVQYNAQGLKTNTTQWQNFYSPIEGYQHSNQERVIIRVKQYPINNPPADSANTAYLLDGYIERERVR